MVFNLNKSVMNNILGKVILILFWGFFSCFIVPTCADGKEKDVVLVVSSTSTHRSNTERTLLFVNTVAEKLVSIWMSVLRR